jgi:hypothetical protein
MLLFNMGETVQLHRGQGQTVKQALDRHEADTWKLTNGQTYVLVLYSSPALPCLGVFCTPTVPDHKHQPSDELNMQGYVYLCITLLTLSYSF